MDLRVLVERAVATEQPCPSSHNTFKITRYKSKFIVHVYTYKHI